METTRDQLAEALYQKGLAVAEIEFVSVRMTETVPVNNVSSMTYVFKL